MVSIDKVKLLESVHLFSRCSLSELAVLARRSDVRSIAGGSEILRAGTVASSLWMVAEGRVALESATGRAELRQGDAIGELSLIFDEPHHATATAITATTMIVLTAKELRSLIREMPMLAEHMLATLADDIISGRLQEVVF